MVRIAGAMTSCCMLVGTSLAQAPGWSRGQQDIKVSYDECVKRAAAALAAEGYRIEHDAGAFRVGIKGAHTAVISCHPISKAKTAVNIVVASNGEGGGESRVTLQGLMEKPGAARPAQPPPPQPPPPTVTGPWGEWFDPEDPDGTGDWDVVGAFPHEKVPCKEPTAVDCRVKSDKRDWRQAGQKYKCSVEAKGGVCLNADNKGACHDYEVRFACPATSAQSRVPAPATPTSTAGTWSTWISRDDPGASADWEALADVKGQLSCTQPAAIECRVKSDKRDWKAAGQKYTCSLAGPNPGGICVNADNPGGCLDYEVRFRCD